ncbi:MAG TPA: diacylglycerol kinase family protein [Rectinemataceae bacterium]|nr:diacylglycerol kinase family protein [Rectinemataceae bacterium]
MHPEDLAEGIRAIVSHSPAFPEIKLSVDIIANPKAGGFKRRRFAARRKNELQQVVALAAALPRREKEVQVRLHLTERCGHASAIAQRVIERSGANGPDSLQIIMTAGGDGTSLETAERLLHLPEELKDRFALLRLPMGTGNDGSEGRDLVVALGRFLSPLKLERRAAVQVRPAEEGGKSPLWAFNIASVGLDAYVAEKTNILKSIFPGDSYKFWVNIATLLYDRAYKVAPMGLKVLPGGGKKPIHASKKLRLFVAMGASGNRQYGSNKRILPSEENIVSCSQTSLLRKLMVKGSIETGRHEGVREIEHFLAPKIELDYEERIPLQCDGEAEVLAGCDFPLVMERVPNLYNVIVPVDEKKAGKRQQMQAPRSSGSNQKR